MRCTGLGKAAFHCYPLLKIVLKWEEMVEEGGTKKYTEGQLTNSAPEVTAELVWMKHLTDSSSIPVVRISFKSAKDRSNDVT